MRVEERVAREQAIRLMGALPEPARRALKWREVDLTAAAEHLLYSAILRPSASSERRLMVIRSIARAASAGVAALRHGAATKAGGRPDVLALVTQPIHATLFAPIERELAERGARAIVVDAETRSGRSVPVAQARLADSLRPGTIPSLAAHAVTTAAGFADAPDAWSTPLAHAEARRLWGLLARGLPLLALEAARIEGLLSRCRPSVVACFSESGQLARLAPAVGYTHNIPVVDLPHAEAADPWGSAGIGYDEVAVYGPRATETMRLAGVAPGRIREIGPLRHDALLVAGASEPAEDPRRVLFAAQPTEETHPALRMEVQRAAMEAAVAVTAQLEPAELIILPHPTQKHAAVEELVGSVKRPASMSVRVERSRSLHAVLPRSWLLITASSQSVFDAILAGVPAMTVNPAGLTDPVTFAREGIALGVRSADAAAAAAAPLVERAARDHLLASQQSALGDRIGPLDGHAAERAAVWLLKVGAAGWRGPTTIGRL